MKVTLTDRYLRSVKPAPRGQRVVVWDGATPNFGIRVTDRRVISFIVMRRQAGKPNPARVTLGSYPAVSLADARRKATGALKALVAGDHPVELAKRARLARAKTEAGSFAAVAEKFIKLHVHRLRSRSDVESAIRRELLPRWGERPIAEISRADVIEVIEDMVDRGHPRGAGLLLAYMRKLFNWQIARSDLGQSPCDRIRATDLIGAMKPRQRVLGDDELRNLWLATAGDDYPLNPFIRLLLITGARRTEVARMTRQELDVDAGTWRLGGDRTKTEDPRILPLPRMALDLLCGLPQWTRGPYLFSTTSGQSPISGFAKLKTRLDRRIAEIDPAMTGWRLHDLRRTMRTHLSALRIEQLVRELMIGHRQTGIAPVYDVHAYAHEQREGFELWAGRLQRIVYSRAARVVNLRGH